jgi:hypothetical protein
MEDLADVLARKLAAIDRNNCGRDARAHVLLRQCQQKEVGEARTWRGSVSNIAVGSTSGGTTPLDLDRIQGRVGVAEVRAPIAACGIWRWGSPSVEHWRLSAQGCVRSQYASAIMCLVKCNGKERPSCNYASRFFRFRRNCGCLLYPHSGRNVVETPWLQRGLEPGQSRRQSSTPDQHT